MSSVGDAATGLARAVESSAEAVARLQAVEGHLDAMAASLTQAWDGVDHPQAEVALTIVAAAAETVEEVISILAKGDSSLVTYIAEVLVVNVTGPDKRPHTGGVPYSNMPTGEVSLAGMLRLPAGRDPEASELIKLSQAQGWQRSQTENGPIEFRDENGLKRLTIKRGTPRTPGSESPHVETRNSDGHRVDLHGHEVTRDGPRRRPGQATGRRSGNQARS